MKGFSIHFAVCMMLVTAVSVCNSVYSQKPAKENEEERDRFRLRKPAKWPKQKITQQTLPIGPAHEVNFQQMADSQMAHPIPARGRFIEQIEDKDADFKFTPHNIPPGTPVFDPDTFGSSGGGRHLARRIQSQRNSPVPLGSFLGTTSNGTLIPPDVDGAAGPSYVVETNNQQYDIYTKTGTLQATLNISTFFSATGGNGFYDPHVLYDPNHQKFILVSDGFFGSGSTNPGGIFIGISETSDPTGSWYTYGINDGDNNQSDLLDYPEVGYNENWLVVTTNDFLTSSVIADIYILNRDSLYMGRLGTATLVTDNNAFSWAPAQTFDTVTNTLWMVQDGDGASGAMQIGSITGTATAPVYNAGSNTSVVSTWNENSIDVGQFGGGTTRLINDDDTRVGNGSVFINGNLWFAHTVWLPATGTATYAGCDWWEVTPSTLTVNQFGRVADPLGNTNYYYPSLNVNSDGDALLGYCMSGTDSFYASAAYSFHASADAVNTMESRYIYKAGIATYYETFSGTRNRYGDFTGTSVDPVDGSFWNFSEWAAGATTWGTTICHVPKPSVLSATSLTSFGSNVCTGTTAGPYSFTITGVALTAANVTVGPLSGFTFSAAFGGPYTSSLSLVQPGGSYSQTIYVDFSPSSAISYSGNIPVSGGGAPTIDVSATGIGTNCTSPTLSAGTILSFDTVCIGNTRGPNSFAVMGTALTSANVTVGPLSGFTFSTTAGGTYTSSLSLAQPGGSYSQTVYVNFSPGSAASYSGNIPVGGGGASGISVAITATGIGVPSITPGTDPSVCASAGSQVANLPYSAPVNSPAAYSISGWSGSSFANVTNAALTNPIAIAVPGGTGPGTYTALLTVANAGCSSGSYSISVTVMPSPAAVTVLPAAPVVCSGAVVITASGGSGGTIYYQGTTSNGTSTATASTSQSITTSGTYYFNAQGSNGCWSAQGSSTVSVTGGIGGATYTIPGSYATLTAAVAAYNAATICGPVVFQLGSGYTSASETFPITINANAGASSANTLTIEPAAGATLVITGSNATAIIKLNAANYITINGSAGGTGTSQNLTIKNTNAGTGSTVIYIASTASAGATNNTIENCILTGNSATTTEAGIMSGGTTTNTLALVANSNNTYQNNAVSKAEYGVLMGGCASGELGNTITGNQITTCGNTGVFIDYEQNLQIANNAISGITSASGSTYGIYIQYTSTGSTVSGNMISGISYTGGTATNVSGIFLGSSTTGTGMNIYNNMIWAITSHGDAGTGNNVYYNGTGITIFEGTGYNIYLNTISLSSAQTVAGAPACIWIYNGGTPTAGALTIEDNILSNTETTPSGVTPYGIYSEIARTSYTAIDYNDYYVGTGSGFANIGGTSYNTIANIQTNFGGNTHSGIIQPNFTSGTDLDLLSYNNFCIASGTAIGGITTDIHGNTRIAPDMGADEFTFTFTGTAAPANCISTNNTVTVSDAASTLAAGTYTVTYNLTGANTATGSTATMTYVAGVTNSGTFTIPAGQLASAGSTTVTIKKIAPTTACVSSLSGVPVTVSSASANQATFNVQATAVAVSISSNDGDTVCAGTNVTFTAVPTNGGSSPVYAWTKNGGSVGTNSATYSDNGLSSGDHIQCGITSNAACASPATAASNTLTMTIHSAPSSVAISDNIDPCNGGHTAYVVVTGGAAPYTFELTPPGSYYTRPSPAEIDAAGAGSISISNVSDANGCAPGTTTGNPVSYPARTLTTGSSQSCTIGANSTQTFYDNSGKLIATVQNLSPTAPMGSTTVAVTIDGSVQETSTTYSAAYPDYSVHPQHYLQRHFVITPAASQSAEVCLYISDAEADALASASGNDIHTAPVYYGTFPASSSTGSAFGSGSRIVEYDGGTGSGTPQTPGNHASTTVISSIAAIHDPVVNGATYTGVWQLCFSVSGFSGFYIYSASSQSGNNNALPVTLVSLTAEPVNNKYIALDWVTASELNNMGFGIERSTDGSTYQTVGWVEGHGTSMVTNEYHYSDLTAMPGITYYYRLRQTDADGNFTYSNIVSAALTGDMGFSLEDLYPNPSGGQVTVAVISNLSTSAILSMTDVLGRRVFQQDWALSIGYNTNVFDLSTVAAGTYMVSIQSGSIKVSRRLTVTK